MGWGYFAPSLFSMELETDPNECARPTPMLSSSNMLEELVDGGRGAEDDVVDPACIDCMHREVMLAYQ